MIKRGPGEVTLNVPKDDADNDLYPSGKSGTIRESNQASGVRKVHYA